MLDGIPCLAQGQRGCVNAEAIGHGITTSGIYVQFKGLNTPYGNMKTWVYLNGKVLNYASNSEGLSEAQVISSIGNKAGNGLFYTNTSAPFNTAYTLQSQFGIGNHNGTFNYINKNMNDTNICAVRGMRLPTLAETTSSMGATLGVPTNSGWAWTSSSSTGGSSYYSVWYQTDTTYNDYYSISLSVRCVR